MSIADVKKKRDDPKEKDNEKKNGGDCANSKLRSWPLSSTSARARGSLSLSSLRRLKTRGPRKKLKEKKYFRARISRRICVRAFAMREREAKVAPRFYISIKSSGLSCNLSHFFSQFLSAAIKKQNKKISESVVEDAHANRERVRKIGSTVRTLEVSFAEATVEVKENIFFL